MTETESNPRYVLFARSYGRTPEEQLEVDRQRSEAATMGDYMGWLSVWWAVWTQRTGHVGALTAHDHAAFDAWLAERVGT